uniref:Vicilin-like storage protein n=1 Tax=Araucaria angustifolia TaxID=56992 RepID=Q8LKI7_ARAAG|nr:vicilin-like storage protein [Araucaria angustifolia]
MANGRFPLLYLVLVLVGFVCAIRCNEVDHYKVHRHGEEEGRNPYVFKEEEQERRLATDAGEIRAVPLFREFSTLVRDLENYELNFFHMKPDAFMRHHYSGADHLSFVLQGKARIQCVRKEKSMEENLDRGNLLFIPRGSMLSIVNNDPREELIMVNLLYNPNPYRQRHHESFYPVDMLNAFRRESLEAAFKVRSEDIERMFSRQDQRVFRFLSREEREKIMGRDDSQLSSFWPLKTRKGEAEEEHNKPFNLEKKDAKYSNKNGKYMEVDSEDYRPLKRQEDRNSMGVGYTRIEPGKITVPYWHSHAFTICVVVRGPGMLQMHPRGGKQQTEAAKGKGEENQNGNARRREEGEGEFRVSYRRVESELRVGDVFVMPAGHASVQMASSERLEFLTFFVNFDRDSGNFLAGNNSVLKQLREEQLAADFGVERKEMQRMIGSQDKAVFVDGPRGSRSLWSIV